MDSRQQNNQPSGSSTPETPVAFDPDKTVSYQARMKRAPRWFGSFLASNSREKNRMRQELEKIRGAIPLLMKPRNGSAWTSHDRQELKRMLRAASAVYPYLIIWALPGSIILLPFLAWRLDVRRKERERRTAENKR